MSSSYQKVSGIAEPLPNDILVIDMEQGGRLTKGGIIMMDDTNFSGISDAASRVSGGVRSRWAKVFRVGSNIDYINPGEYVLIAHGRWTYAVDFTDTETGETVKLQKVDVEEILLVDDEIPTALAEYYRVA